MLVITDNDLINDNDDTNDDNKWNDNIDDYFVNRRHPFNCVCNYKSNQENDHDD